MSRALNIFISYKRGESNDAAREIENYLTRKKNYSVFRDVDKIEGGEDWNQIIIRSIKRSDIFILLLTPLSLLSGEVEKEVREAQKWKKRILPCKHENVNIEELKWDLGKLNIIEYSEKNISALLLSIDDSIDAYIYEKRKQSVKKGISIALPIIAIGLVTYILLGYFLSPEIVISYQSDPDMIIGTDYAQMFSNLSSPSGITVDTLGNVYVADTENNRIQKFTSDGNFTKEWGELGSGPGNFSRPSGITVDTLGNVYVADTENNRIQKFTSDGNFTKEWGQHGSGPGNFSSPSGIATDTSGNVYVADTYNNRIQKFTPNGTITEWGELGKDQGQFSSPSGIATDTSGNVYVADTGNNRIQKFTSGGKYLLAIGEFGHGKENFNLPVDIDIDTKDNIFVVDKGNNRIQKIEGSSIKKWLDEFEFDSPSGIALDGTDNLYISDTNNHKIYRFDPSGKNVSYFGGFGFNSSTLNFPSGIAVDKDRNVYVADTGNNQIKKFIVKETPTREFHLFPIIDSK